MPQPDGRRPRPAARRISASRHRRRPTRIPAPPPGRPDRRLHRCCRRRHGHRRPRPIVPGRASDERRVAVACGRCRLCTRFLTDRSRFSHNWASQWCDGNHDDGRVARLGESGGRLEEPAAPHRIRRIRVRPGPPRSGPGPCRRDDRARLPPGRRLAGSRRRPRPGRAPAADPGGQDARRLRRPRVPADHRRPRVQRDPLHLPAGRSHGPDPGSAGILLPPQDPPGRVPESNGSAAARQFRAQGLRVGAGHVHVLGSSRRRPARPRGPGRAPRQSPHVSRLARTRFVVSNPAG